MEETEVLLETDPLARYIQSLNIPLEIEKVKKENKKRNFKEKISGIFMGNPTKIDNHKYQDYRNCVIHSELLFSDDTEMILEYSDPKCIGHFTKINYIKWLSVPLTGITIFIPKSMKIRLLIGSCFLLKSLWDVYRLAEHILVKTVIRTLITTLKRFTGLIKKSLFMIVQYMTSLNYYSADRNKLSLGRKLNAFLDKYCTLLNTVTKTLRQKCSNLLSLVPLKVELNEIEQIEMTGDVKLKDIRMLYEYYLLVQSHLLKIIALIFTPNLWTLKEIDRAKVLTEIKSITIYIVDKINYFTDEFNLVKNIKTPEENKITIMKPNLIISGMHDNLNLARMHLHQLVSKVEDALRLYENVHSEPYLTSVYKDLEEIIKEVETQIDNPKHYINAISIVLQRTHNKEVAPLDVVAPVPNNDESTSNQFCNLSEQETARGNEVYELFIPKEGLPPIDDFLSDEKFIPPKNITYQTTLLGELRQVLKERNPDVVAEEERLKEAAKNERSDTPPPEKEIFHPQQPVGFVVNASLQSILAARQQMRNDDEFGDDTFGDDEIYDD